MYKPKGINLAFLLVVAVTALSFAQNLNRQSFSDMEQKNERRLIEVPDIDNLITIKKNDNVSLIDCITTKIS